MVIGLLSLVAISGYKYVMDLREATEIQDIVSQTKALTNVQKIQTVGRIKRFLNQTPVEKYNPNVTKVDISERNSIYTVTLTNIPQDVQNTIWIKKGNFAKMNILVQPNETVLQETGNNAIGQTNWTNDGMSTNFFKLLKKYNFTETILGGSSIAFVFDLSTGLGNATHLKNMEFSDRADNENCMTTYWDDLTQSNKDCPSGQCYDTVMKKCAECPAECGGNSSPDGCPLGKVRNPDTDTCECPEGTYGDNCVTCVEPETYWNEDSEKCECPLGEYLIDGVCMGCGRVGMLVIGGNQTCPSSKLYSSAINKGWACGFSRDNALTGIVDAEGLFIADTTRMYKFGPLHGYTVKYGEVRYVRLYIDDVLVLSTNGYGANSVSVHLTKGAHKIRYQARVYKRTNIRFNVDGGKVCSPCPKDSFLKNGECISCTIDKSVKGAEQCKDCAEKGIRFWSDKSGCTLCFTPSTISNTTQANCYACDNRFHQGSGKKCINCNTTTVYQTTQAECHRCDNRFWEAAKFKCYLCSTEDDVDNVDKNTCLRCENRFWKSIGKHCLYCDSKKTYSDVTLEECMQCPNRSWQEVANGRGTCEICGLMAEGNDEGTACSCKFDNQFFSNTNNCRYCEDPTKNIKAASESECKKCKNRFWRESDKGCLLCDIQNNYWKNTKMENCHICSNMYWRESDKSCFTCDYASGTKNTTLEECQRCPNRYWTENKKNPGTGTCSPCKNGGTATEDGLSCYCESENEFVNSSFTCTTCDDKTTKIKPLSQEECEKCENLGLRFWRESDKLCLTCNLQNNYWTKTEEEKCHICKNMYWRKSDKYCWACDYSSTTSKTALEECMRCSNRYWTSYNDSTGLGKCTPCGAGANRTEDGLNCTCLEDTEFLNSSRACKACDDETKSIKPFSYEECQKCENLHLRFWRNNDKTCLKCNATNTSYKNTLEDECHICENTYHSGTTCYTCDFTDGTKNTTLGECKRCPNRYWTPSTTSENYADTDLGTCSPCGKGGLASEDKLSCYCPGDSDFLNSSKTCQSCEDTDKDIKAFSETECQKCENLGLRFWRQSDSMCLTCDLTNTFWKKTEANHCEKCPNMYQGGTNCYTCDYASGTTETTFASCRHCPNRYWTKDINNPEVGTCTSCGEGSAVTEDGLSCYCASDSEFLDSNTVCTSCDSTTKSINAYSQSECEKCEKLGLRVWNTINCLACNLTNTYHKNLDQTYCQKCPNMYHAGSHCYTCDYASGTSKTTLGECKRCPNRYWTPSTTSENYADTDLGTCTSCGAGGLATEDKLSCYCPNDTEFLNSKRVCIACNDETKLITPFSEAECKKCETGGYRFWHTSGCLSCNQENTYYEKTTQEQCDVCENMYFSSNNCYTCDYTKTTTGTTLDNCKTCPNRYWVEDSKNPGLGSCYPCGAGALRTEDGLSCYCASDSEFLNSSRVCISCNDPTEEIKSFTKEECQKCGGKSTTTDKGEDEEDADMDVDVDVDEDIDEDINIEDEDVDTDTDTDEGTGDNVDEGTGEDTGEDGIEDAGPLRFWRKHDGACLKCNVSDTKWNDTEYDECHTCKNTYHSGSTCYTCDFTGETKNTTLGECQKCPKRYLTETESGKGTCTLCGTEAVSDESGLKCTCEDPTKFVDSSNNCQTCDMPDIDPKVAYKETCDICADQGLRYYKASKSTHYCLWCAAEDEQSGIEEDDCKKCTERFWNTDKKCISCVKSGTYSNVTLEQCKRCSNRYWQETSDGLGKCIVCGDGSIADKNGLRCVCEDTSKMVNASNVCVTCDTTTENQTIAYKETCDICSNQGLRYYWLSGSTHYCTLCSKNNAQSGVEKEDCNKCAERFWYESGGKQYCTLCSYTKDSNTNTTQDQCKRCNNRYWTPNNDGTNLGKCVRCATGTTATADGLSCE